VVAGGEYLHTPGSPQSIIGLIEQGALHGNPSSFVLTGNTMVDVALASVLRAERSEDFLDSVRTIARRDLAPLVAVIDREGFYPEAVLRTLGAAGAFASHVRDLRNERCDLRNAIEAMSIASEHCLATAFCMWCQNALAWYVFTSANDELKSSLGERIAAGQVLGGTGLSNPMKALFGIERMRLKARRVIGGYSVKGVLPWVSNLGADHWFGAVFELEDRPGHWIMALIDCADGGVKIVQNDHFLALEGTRTFTVQLRDAFIPDKQILADPIDNYILRIRSGFILLQTGMAFGLVDSCIELMRRERLGLGHVNRYLEKQPEEFEARLRSLRDAVWSLAKTPFDQGPLYFRSVVQARLEAAEMAVEASHYAMLHQGAKGYVANGSAQRRLREAYFVAIVTPATKQLRKMLAELSHG
jgi:alkylation response protein AidB-like acyl-CoA dehydrogenase